MNRIFYIHSNILAICCYQTVKEAITQNEKVIIITNRQCQWTFFLDKVLVFDFAEMFKGEDRKRIALHDLKAVKDYVRYRRYLYHLDKVVDDIVAGEDYVFYMPSVALSMTVAFAYNKHCKGYYYVDEGSLAYLPQELTNPQVYSRGKSIIKKFLKIEDHCHYEIMPTFRGTISITEDAFKWNMEREKITNPIDECILELKNNLPSFDDVIVTARLEEDINLIIKSVDFVVEYILDKKQDSKIGIKLHPNAITYNRDKTLMLLQYIKNKYNNIISIIPSEISIEAMSLVYHPRLFSLFSLSSLILYGLLFQSSDGYLIKNENNTISVENIATVEEYYKLISIVNLGK